MSTIPFKERPFLNGRLVITPPDDKDLVIVLSEEVTGAFNRLAPEKKAHLKAEASIFFFQAELAQLGPNPWLRENAFRADPPLAGDTRPCFWAQIKTNGGPLPHWPQGPKVPQYFQTFHAPQICDLDIGTDLFIPTVHTEKPSTYYAGLTAGYVGPNDYFKLYQPAQEAWENLLLGEPVQRRQFSAVNRLVYVPPGHSYTTAPRR